MIPTRTPSSLFLLIVVSLSLIGCGKKPGSLSNQNASELAPAGRKAGEKPLKDAERFLPTTTERSSFRSQHRNLTETTNIFSYHVRGIVLSNVNLRVVFWGKAWLSDTPPTPENPRPSNAAGVTDATRTMVSSNYITGPSEYQTSIERGTLAAAVKWSTTEPRNGFSEDDIENFVRDRIKDRTLPYPDDPNHLYLIVLPKGIKFQFNADGEHWFINYTEPDKPDFKQVHLGFIVNDGS